MFYAVFALAAALASCGSSSPTEADPCVSLSEASCLESTVCTLVQLESPGPYSCRAAADSCEEGFRQTIDTETACEAETGCSFTPGNCYCPPGMTCICGGGPPPQCSAT